MAVEVAGDDVVLVLVLVLGDESAAWRLALMSFVKGVVANCCWVEGSGGVGG